MHCVACVACPRAHQYIALIARTAHSILSSCTRLCRVHLDACHPLPTPPQTHTHTRCHLPILACRARPRRPAAVSPARWSRRCGLRARSLGPLTSWATRTCARGSRSSPAGPPTHRWVLAAGLVGAAWLKALPALQVALPTGRALRPKVAPSQPRVPVTLLHLVTPFLAFLSMWCCRRTPPRGNSSFRASHCLLLPRAAPDRPLCAAGVCQG